MLVYLNKYSRAGKGSQLWQKAENEIAGRFPDEQCKLVTDRSILSRRIAESCDRGERHFVAAGGDGTVNTLLGEIMKLKSGIREEIIIGAVGLGSSNDFHKPLERNSFLDGDIPVRLDFKNPREHNVGKITFIDESNRELSKYFIINCSLGIVAEANHFFNNGSGILRFLKSRSTAAAIWYAGLKSLLGFKNIACRVTSKHRNLQTGVSNLGILIKPNFSGEFRYDIDVDSTSDYLGVAICDNMGLVSRINTIGSLARGRFRDLPRTRAWKTRSLEIVSARPVPFEFDGEIVIVTKVGIKLLKKAVRVCA